MGVSRTQVVKFIRKGDPGDKGEQGATLRGPQAWSDCAVGYAFQAGKVGEQWIDVVLYNNNYYTCKKSHTKTASNYPGSTTDRNNGYWQLGDKIQLVATKILLAAYALVENLGATAIEMKDSSGNVVFKAKDGNITCKTGTFENIKVIGSLRNPFAYVGDSITSDYNDNVAMLSSGGGWINAYSLPWDTKQSGRRITIVNYKWGSTISEGQAGISAPSGKYFYENGVSKNSLLLSREAVELMGYGTSTQFYGWIVMRRIDMMTSYRYGKELKILAFGSVTSAGGLTYTSFDKSTLRVTKNGTGQYTITMPSGWFYTASNVGVMLTGVGYSSGSSEAPIKATLISRTTTQLVIKTSDDASVNDGAFDFMIFNKSDWSTI